MAASFERGLLATIVVVFAYFAYHDKERLLEFILTREYKALVKLDEVIAGSKAKYSKVAVGWDHI